MFALPFHYVRYPSNLSPAMDRTVAHLNIEHYRRLLAAETDQSKRKTLQKLLAEEEAKLERARQEAKKQQPKP
jgi:hypothetical protein